MPTEQEFLGSDKWVKKVKDHFTTTLDKNKNGYLSQEDWLLWLDDNFKSILGIGEEKLKQVREVHLKLASLLGAKPGVQLTPEEFVKGAAKFAANEAESRACLKEVNEIMFDVLDTNKDGTVNLEEYAKLLQTYNMAPELAKPLFDSIDANHNGKIEVKELFEVTNKFWFTLD